MALAYIQNRSARNARAEEPAPGGLAATLREVEPGTPIRLLLRDGDEVSGDFDGVSEGTIGLGDGRRRVGLEEVKRLHLAYSPKRRAA